MKYKDKQILYSIYRTNPYYKEKYAEIKKLESILNIKLDWNKIKKTHMGHLNDLIESLKNQIK
jgi:ribosome-binding protein aMBF1 (putative translation factor)